MNERVKIADSAVSPARANMRKVFVKTYGCQMNVYDSQRMADALGADGYVETASPDDADMVLLNTCHIREKAAEKVYSELGRLRKLRDMRRADGREILDIAPTHAVDPTHPAIEENDAGRKQGPDEGA